MLEQIKRLARQKRTCVLATVDGDKPYCSLMAYVTDEDCEEIYMVTHKDTRKYRNLLANPAASIMIDSRELKSRAQAQALTVEGACCRIEDEDKEKQVRAMLLKAHPQLKGFVDHPDAALLCIKVNSFLLLNGLTESHFIEMP
jgi:nitroimidazol reductase NimA-like FMN-containing flavoprotein (pyridoxamine 5'-phosphate oxidase superfamily)